MEQLWLQVAVVLSVLGNAMLAGIYASFVCAIAPGFKTLSDTEYVNTFRKINAAIVNPGFLTLFLLSPALSVITAVGLFHDWSQSWPVVLGSALSVASTLISTMINFPLNRLLAQRRIVAPWEARRARRLFQGPWNRWNVLRMLGNAGAAVGSMLVILRPGGS